MLTMNKLNLQYGSKHIFREVFAIYPDNRIKMIGATAQEYFYIVMY